MMNAEMKTWLLAEIDMSTVMGKQASNYKLCKYVDGESYKYIFQIPGGPTYRVGDLVKFRKLIEKCAGFSNHKSKAPTLSTRLEMPTVEGAIKRMLADGDLSNARDACELYGLSFGSAYFEGVVTRYFPIRIIERHGRELFINKDDMVFDKLSGRQLCDLKKLDTVPIELWDKMMNTLTDNSALIEAAYE